MRPATPDSTLLDRLKSIVGPKAWVDPDDAGKYFDDPRRHFHGSAALVVLPKTTEQVSAVVTACNAAQAGIIPFGGGTGGVAGHMEIDGKLPVILSLERMDAIRYVSVEDDTIIAEAGCVLATVQATARENNRRFGLSLASEGSCTIGGNLATNAGGLQVLRYGNSRDLCLGIEAVMPDGSVLDDLNPLRKNNTGYDLRHLLIGSEGTLGIITAAALKLSPRPEESVTVMCAVDSPDDALALLHAIRDGIGETVTAFELMSDLGLRLASRHFEPLRSPFRTPHEWCVLAEIEGCAGIREPLEQILAGAMERRGLVDAVIAESESQSRSLWELRELAYEYNQREGVLFSSDTSVPIGRIGRFIASTVSAVHDLNPDLRVNCYGHIGDGNIHINFFPPEGVAKHAYLRIHPEAPDTLRRIVNETTHRCDGSISAEHGIGRLKTAELQRFADPTKLATMRAIKDAIDPNGIMNPGALFTATKAGPSANSQ